MTVYANTDVFYLAKAIRIILAKYLINGFRRNDTQSFSTC